MACHSEKAVEGERIARDLEISDDAIPIYLLNFIVPVRPFRFLLNPKFRVKISCDVVCACASPILCEISLVCASGAASSGSPQLSPPFPSIAASHRAVHSAADWPPFA